MTIRDRLISTGGVALVGALLEAGTVSAHAGEDHAAGGSSEVGGIGLLAVVIAVAVAYWLANRADRRSRNVGLSDPDLN